MHLYVEPLQKAKAIERLWVLYELATNFDSYGELSLGFSKKGHAELQAIARDLATELESDVRGRDGVGLRAAKARRYPHSHRQHPPSPPSRDVVSTTCTPFQDYQHHQHQQALDA